MIPKFLIISYVVLQTNKIAIECFIRVDNMPINLNNSNIYSSIVMFITGTSLWNSIKDSYRNNQFIDLSDHLLNYRNLSSFTVT